MSCSGSYFAAFGWPTSQHARPELPNSRSGSQQGRRGRGTPTIGTSAARYGLTGLATEEPQPACPALSRLL